MPSNTKIIARIRDAHDTVVRETIKEIIRMAKEQHQVYKNFGSVSSFTVRLRRIFKSLIRGYPLSYVLNSEFRTKWDYGTGQVIQEKTKKYHKMAGIKESPMDTVTKEISKMGLVVLETRSLYTFRIGFDKKFYDRYGRCGRTPACKILRNQIQMKGPPGKDETKEDQEKRLRLNQKKLPKDVVNHIIDYVCLSLDTQSVTMSLGI